MRHQGDRSTDGKLDSPRHLTIHHESALAMDSFVVLLATSRLPPRLRASPLYTVPFGTSGCGWGTGQEQSSPGER